MIVEDNVVCFPAILASGRPWVRIVSCNPLEVKDPGIPPVFSGYPADDRSAWHAFRAEYLRPTADCTARSARSARSAARRRCPVGDFIHESPLPQPLPLPGRGRLRPRAAAGADLAPPRHVRPGRDRDVRVCRPARRRERRARLPLARQPRLRRRRADAAARRRPLAARPTGSSSRRARSTTSSSWPTTCGAASTCRSPRSCRTSIS